MAQEIRCANPSCGRASRLGDDGLGRTFRCPRCGAKLPTRVRPPAAESAGPDEAPWERERVVARSLGAAAPARLGRFRVVAAVTGSDGSVGYRAVDPGQPGEVVLRVVAVGTGPRSLTALLERAVELAEPGHPGLVPVLEAAPVGPTLLVVAPYLAGPTLAERIASEGRFAPDRAALVAAELAEALAAAHARGVVHGDITPDRVRFDPAGRPRLGDFRFPSPAADRLPDEVEAAPAYVAPERLGPEPGPFGPEGDQYGLGALLYEMICGRPPYEGPADRVAEEVRTGDPIPLRDWRPRLSRRLERVCERAMARDPAERYPSCLDLAADLRRRTRTARVVVPVRAAARWVQSRPAAALSATIAAIGLVATTTVLATTVVASMTLPHLAPLDRPGEVRQEPTRTTDARGS